MTNANDELKQTMDEFKAALVGDGARRERKAERLLVEFLRSKAANAETVDAAESSLVQYWDERILSTETFARCRDRIQYWKRPFEELC